MEFDSPLLLADYVRWGSIKPDTNPPFPNEVETCLRLIEGIARIEFPSEVGTTVSSYVEAALKARPEEVREHRIDSPSVELQQQYLSTLLDMNRSEAVRIAINAIHSGIGVGEFYLEVLQPTQLEIGRLWQTGCITVAQEHYCTAVTQFVMSQLQPYFLHKRSRQKTLIATCVGNELHEVGLRIVSDIFEIDGWNTIYLGLNPASVST